MFFNSIDFAIFLPIVFILYWFIFKNNLKLQNLLIVIASYIFYGWWDYKFLSLIFLSTLFDFIVGIQLDKTDSIKKRKALLWFSILMNLGFLGFFKYSNFFIDNFVSAFSFFGHPISVNSLDIVLPVGISFYTFQTMSYTIDVYRRNLKSTNDFVQFSAFVSFFPQLVAGPIERATNLLPQFNKKRNFNYDLAVLGLRQILWGLFKKIVIADNCAKYVNIVFDNPDAYSSSTLAVAAVFFAFQIYCDFSGYSDIAIGLAKLFGFDLMKNFSFPYFSRDIAEFWRRWHISLSTWFRDYLYIPLGGSKGGKWMKIRNTFIIFLVSGFWHGASWNFVIWGFLNALYFLPLLLAKKNRNNLNSIAEGKLFPSVREFFGMLITFSLTVFAWIFFRAETVTDALHYIKRLFEKSLFESPTLDLIHSHQLIILLIFIFFLIEWLGRTSSFAIEKLPKNKIIRYGFYYAVMLLIFFLGGASQEFIYFQF